MLVERAEKAADMRRFDQAKELAGQAIAADPELMDAFQVMARACLGLNQLDLAEEHLRTALTFDPSDRWTLRVLSLVLRLKGKLPEATAMAQECLRIEPDYDEAHMEYGSCLQSAKKYKEAQQAFERAVALSPESVRALELLGDFYLSRKFYPAAEKVYRRALAVKPNSASILNNLGICLENQDKLKEAALAYKSALVLDPNMQAAKENTERSVESILGGGALGLTILIFVGAKTIQIIGRTFGRNALVIAICVALIILLCVGVWFYNRFLRKKAEEQLSETDPQLLEIYERLKKFG
jgi:tetratricopeptide (TPR) repeat protein